MTEAYETSHGKAIQIEIGVVPNFSSGDRRLAVYYIQYIKYCMF